MEMQDHRFAPKPADPAALGQKDEAASAVTMAEEVGDPAFIPGLAGTHWRCGVALRLMQREDAAIEQFRLAAKLDPYGLYGKLADSAIHQPAIHASFRGLIESQG